MSRSRIDQLSEVLEACGLSALVLNPGASLVYLTGLHFHLMERPTVVIFTPGAPPVVVLPELEMLKVKELSYEVRAFAYGEQVETWAQVFRAAMSSLKLDGKKIGVEPRQMRLLEFGYVKPGAPGAEFPDASEIVSRLRVHKDADEVAAIRKSVGVAQKALEATLPLVKIGMSEKELAAELAIQLLRHGSQAELAFSPIVSSGPNSANPHAEPSERKLAPGDLLVVDWGALVDGYVSDLTRTFAVGEVQAEYAKIHAIVQEANAAGRDAAGSGVACGLVDRAARGVIEQAGYGIYFTHRTGHGIGMEGHEDPYMRADNMSLLEPGMAFTVEPGIYLPGRNGVRIEDDMVITASGADCLSDLPREMRVVG